MIRNKLKEIRMKEYMMNQREFAEQILDIDYRKYNHYENSTSPSAETMIIIAKKLKKPIEDIFYIIEE
jgi:putative transcriptional regulator